jgi:Big-like domain-containing protein
MTRQGWLRFVLALSIAACGSEPSDPPGDDTGFRVTGVEPADGAADVAWTATFDATLSAALDPASLATGSVELLLDGTRVPSVITYDTTGHRIRIVAPLLPGATYRAELGSGLRSADGDSLTAHTWTVTTRAWDPGPLTGLGRLDYFALALGPSGSVHLFGSGDHRPWSDYTTPYMKYAACASNCADPASWGRMAVDSSYEPLSGGALVVSPSGRVHLMHVGHVLGDVELRLGTCPSDCLSPANWTLATLDVDRRIIGFAQDDGGVLHLVTGPQGGNPELRYATCAAGCTEPANWAATPIPGIGLPGTGDVARGLQVDTPTARRIAATRRHGSGSGWTRVTTTGARSR